MQKLRLVFLFGVAIVAMPLISNGQSNSLGDRGSSLIENPGRRIHKQRISRRQKLLLKKPDVRHTAKYEYYGRVEEIAREKQHLALKKQAMFPKSEFSHSAEYDYYKRIELAAKNKQRIIREMAKPQYSDFSYFGHKHPPKRHLPYAMRYCKECGIRH